MKRPDSSYQERLYRVSQRLQSIQSNFDGHRSSRMTDLEKAVENIEEQLYEHQRQNSRQIASLKSNIAEFLKELDTNKESREGYFNNKTEQLLEI